MIGARWKADQREDGARDLGQKPRKSPVSRGPHHVRRDRFVDAERYVAEEWEAGSSATASRKATALFGASRAASTGMSCRSSHSRGGALISELDEGRLVAARVYEKRR
jgi:hypothetical protein